MALPEWFPKMPQRKATEMLDKRLHNLSKMTSTLESACHLYLASLQWHCNLCSLNGLPCSTEWIDVYYKCITLEEIAHFLNLYNKGDLQDIHLL